MHSPSPVSVLVAVLSVFVHKEKVAKALPEVTDKEQSAFQQVYCREPDTNSAVAPSPDKEKTDFAA